MNNKQPIGLSENKKGLIRRRPKGTYDGLIVKYGKLKGSYRNLTQPMRT